MSFPTEGELYNAYEHNVAAYEVDEVDDYVSQHTSVVLDRSHGLVAILDAEMDLVALVPKRAITTDGRMLHEEIVRLLNEAPDAARRLR